MDKNFQGAFLFVFLFLFVGHSIYSQANTNSRVIVLTDIEADPDDTQSLIRLLLYSNRMDVKGLIATTSCWLQNEVNPESIERILNRYGEVRPNLLKHESGFPEVEALRRIVKRGLPLYGMKGVGKEMKSEGSDWIISELKKEDDRPLWISVWGGVNTLAQALYTIQSKENPSEQKRLISKLRVYTISDQDDSGIWIRNSFPELFYIVSPGDHYGSATWTGINSVIPGIDNSVISNSWFVQNIQQDHGSLGALYPDVSWGVEGDTPAFLSLIPNGLNDSEHPEWGGWGGRYELHKPDFSQTKKGGSIVEIGPETRPIWTNAIDSYVQPKYKEYGRTFRKDTVTHTGYKETLWRWRDEFQNDFAARMDWCIQDYEEANHPPIPRLSHSDRITVHSNEKFKLDAINSTDPDGDNLSFFWFPYLEAGSYQGPFELGQPENASRVYAQAPVVSKAETIHIILKLSDKGIPSISRYKRIIVTVLPK